MQDLPKIVLKRLQETAAGKAHPDADLLTAFAEQSLGESERGRVMEHLARCSDCREVVALALPATEAVALASSTSSTSSGWLRWPALRWSVVAAVIVAITSVGILRYRQRRENETFVSNLAPRGETATTAGEALPPSPAASESHDVIPQAEKERQAEIRRKMQSSIASNLSADRLSRAVNPGLPAASAKHDAASRSVTGGDVGFGSGAGLAPRAALSTSGDNAAVAGDLKNATPEETAKFAPKLSANQMVEVAPSTQTVEVESQTAEVTPNAANQVSDQVIESQKQQPSQHQSSATLGVVEAKDAATAYSLQLASPRWSISSDGSLQRSFDGGNTWTDVNVNPEATASLSKEASSAVDTFGNAKVRKKVEAKRSPGPVFRAVAALGTEVWAGGSAAMLYHSVDSGDHWTRVLPSASGAVLTGDITSIEFSDTQHGRIATSTGEVWITADDGRTWHRQ